VLKDWQMAGLIVAALIAATGVAYYSSSGCGERRTIGTVLLPAGC
jgi:hypothetical protein